LCFQFEAMQDNIISLHKLTLLLESQIDDSFGKKYFWLTAEISSINVRRGHCYINLIDKDVGSTFPKAEMKAIIWQNHYQRINDSFSSITGFSLKQDIRILCLATVNFSPRYGLSLQIFEIKGEFTLGGMMQDRQKTVATLIKNGLYEKNKQIQLPQVPQRIAALSAGDSKGFEDFLKILSANEYGYGFHVKLFPVMLQGNRAAESISKQMQEIEKQKHNFDIVVLVRGGGGNVDLHCFNSYILSEAIALSPLPVVTGIGHTTDYTVADEVAAIHKETPTAVAQYIVNLTKAFEEDMAQRFERLSRLSLQILDHEEVFIEKSLDAITYKPHILLEKEKAFMDKSGANLGTMALSGLKVALSTINYQEVSLRKGVHKYMEMTNKLLEHHQQYLSAHDPMLLLKRGYSITRCQGIIIKQFDDLKNGVEIETQLADGHIISTINQLNTKQKKHENHEL
jgi:exodeoxyribonuclease VII large subunit